MKRGMAFGVAMAAFFLWHGPAEALDPDDMARLTNAGLGGEVIQALIDEKAIETCAFTVDEIIGLKQSGMSDDAIAGVIRKGSFTKGPQKVVYGETTKTVGHISPADMIQLKEAGIGDDVLKEIARGNVDRDDREHRRAWDMLDSMGLLVDGRRGADIPPPPK